MLSRTSFCQTFTIVPASLSTKDMLKKPKPNQTMQQNDKDMQFLCFYIFTADIKSLTISHLAWVPLAIVSGIINLSQRTFILLPWPLFATKDLREEQPPTAGSVHDARQEAVSAPAVAP